MVEFTVDVIGDDGTFYATYEVVTTNEANALAIASDQALDDGCGIVEEMKVIITEGSRAE